MKTKIAAIAMNKACRTHCYCHQLQELIELVLHGTVEGYGVRRKRQIWFLIGTLAPRPSKRRNWKRGAQWRWSQDVLLYTRHRSRRSEGCVSSRVAVVLPHHGIPHDVIDTSAATGQHRCPTPSPGVRVSQGMRHVTVSAITIVVLRSATFAALKNAMPIVDLAPYVDMRSRKMLHVSSELMSLPLPPSVAGMALRREVCCVKRIRSSFMLPTTAT